jgi:hypothetical protein
MGKHVENDGGPHLHTHPAGLVVEVMPLTRHHEDVTGPAVIAIGPPLPLETYAAIHAAASTSIAAFEAAIAGSPWGPGYAAWPVESRHVVIRHILAVPPRAALPALPPA